MAGIKYYSAVKALTVGTGNINNIKIYKVNVIKYAALMENSAAHLSSGIYRNALARGGIFRGIADFEISDFDILQRGNKHRLRLAVAVYNRLSSLAVAVDNKILTCRSRRTRNEHLIEHAAAFKHYFRSRLKGAVINIVKRLPGRALGSAVIFVIAVLAVHIIKSVSAFFPTCTVEHSCLFYS